MVVFIYNNFKHIRIMKADYSQNVNLFSSNNFWCHSCKLKFSSQLRPGIDEVKCPRCLNDFCEFFTSHSQPSSFQPYQKPLKQKKHLMSRSNRRATSQVVRLALQQLASDLHAVKVRQITPQMVEDLKVIVEKEIEECMICKEEIKVGEEGLESPCKHTFHIDCLSQWLTYKNSCPKCRHKVLEKVD